MELTEDKVKGMIQDAVIGSTPSDEKIEEILTRAIKSMDHPSIFKQIVRNEGDVKYEQKLQAAKFFKGLFDISRGRAPEMDGKAIADDILNTSTSTGAGYLVPTYVKDEVARILPQKSLVAAKATFFPMTATTTLPTLSSGPSVTYTDELGEKADTKPVFGQRTFTLKTGAAIVPMSNQLIESSVINLVDFIITLLAEAFATNLDTVSFQDASTPFVGILNAAGKSKTLAATKVITDLAFGDLVDMVAQLETASIAGAEWYFSPTVFGVVRKLKDDENRPLYLGPGLGVPPTILDLKYNLSDQMPTATAGGSADTAVFFLGDLSKYYVGVAHDLRISMSKEATITTATGSYSAFERNLTLIRGECRHAGNLSTVNSFCKLESGSAS
jgi:HK97 family phage major capsid protein